MALLKLPGLIDPHVHLRDPGQTEKEDFYTGTCAALAGGYTTVIDMPNNKTPITTLERLEEKEKIAKEKIVCDVGFHFGSMGDNLKEFAKVKGKVLGLKLYLNKTTGNFLLDRGNLKEIFLAWANTPALHSSGVLVKKNPPILLHAEKDSIQDAIQTLKQIRVPVHFCHTSSKEDLEQIIDAKHKGFPVTCGVTPHHLFLTEHDVKILGPFGTMKPPLGTSKDREFLWKNIHYIDIIESDHAPHTVEEKVGKVSEVSKVSKGNSMAEETNFRMSQPERMRGDSSGRAPDNAHSFGSARRSQGGETRGALAGGKDEAGPYPKKKQIPYGVPGLETSLPLLLTAVSEKKLTIDDVIQMCHTNPTKIFGIQQDNSTYIEVDPNAQHEIKNDNLFTKCKWSPFNGWKVKGKVIRVYIRATKVFEDGKILVKPGFGKIINPQ